MDMTDNEVDLIIKALANPVRREILVWLKHPELEFPSSQCPFEHGVCVGLINERSKLSQSTISTHLATLQRAGLLESRRHGQWIYYRRNETVISAFTQHMQSAL
jgi:ArsR family transcriptional regulator